MTAHGKQVEKAQERNAHGCSVTVVTAADPLIHHRGVIQRELAEDFGDDARYDLLSFVDLPAAFEDGAIGQTAADIKTAVSLHNAENVLVVSPDGDGSKYVKLLSEYFMAHHRELCHDEFNILGSHHWSVGESRPYGTLVVSCMDYRLHGPRGTLSKHLARTLPSDYGLMTIPGVGKDIARHDAVRIDLLKKQLMAAIRRGVDHVVLVAHTDCGKYGGSKSFGTYLDEFGALREDLRVMAAMTRRRGETFGALETLRVDIAIASLQIDALCTVA